MSRGARVSAIVVFFVLLLVGLATGPDPREATETTFGKVPTGQGAVYDLLRELGLPVARSFAAPAALPEGATVWWIQPDDGCSSAMLADPGFRGWLARGGTAVVFLPPALSACAEGAGLAGIALPPRTGDCLCGEEHQALPAVVRGPGEQAGEPFVLEGPLLRAPRTLEVPHPVAFAAEREWGEAAQADAPDGAWEVAAGDAARPFAVSHRVGQGRIVVFAEGRFLENGELDRADSALVAVDVALALGPPRIDERGHGLVPSRSTLAYLARSAAALPFAGLALLTLAFAWFGGAEPPRRVAELPRETPTLETYVQSLAGLYAATRDHARVLARYRELTARRLRRDFGLPPDAPLAALALRLERRGGVSRRALAELRSEAPARSAAALARGVALLDRLVEEAKR